MRNRSIITLLLILFFCSSTSVYSEQKADSVLVVKSEARLYLINNGLTFAEFHVAFGSNPRGHKKEQGDGRTPEGKYILDYKNVNSAYYKSIHISYPNAKDRADARRRHAHKLSSPCRKTFTTTVKPGTSPCTILLNSPPVPISYLAPTGTKLKRLPPGSVPCS